MILCIRCTIVFANILIFSTFFSENSRIFVLNSDWYLRTKWITVSKVKSIRFVCPSNTHWSWTKASENMSRVAQRLSVRDPWKVVISLRDKMRNQWITQQTKIVDVMERIAWLKLNWVGNVAGMTDERWRKNIM